MPNEKKISSKMLRLVCCVSFFRDMQHISTCCHDWYLNGSLGLGSTTISQLESRLANLKVEEHSKFGHFWKAHDQTNPTRYGSKCNTAIPRFVRTSNSALSISAQKQILTTPRFVRIINSISAHVSQLRCCNFDVVWEGWRHFCYDAPVMRYQFGWSY